MPVKDMSALQKMPLEGRVTAEWRTSETNRKVRFYRQAAAAGKQLDAELAVRREVAARAVGHAFRHE